MTDVAVIIAEREELPNIHRIFKCNKFFEFNGITFFVGGQFNDLNLIFCYCGVGKVNAAISTMCLLNNFSIDLIINIGFCGTFCATMKVGDLAIARRVQYADVDLTPFQSVDNFLPDLQDKYYSVSQQDQDLIKQINWTKNDLHLADVLTSDSVAKQSNVDFLIRDYQEQACVFDMEAMAIAHVCLKNKTRVVFVKRISDNFYLSTKQKEEYKFNLSTAGKTNNLILQEVLKQLSCK